MTPPIADAATCAWAARFAGYRAIDVPRRHRFNRMPDADRAAKELTDDALESEIELVGELVVAATSSSGPLAQDQIDRLLGIVPAPAGSQPGDPYPAARQPAARHPAAPEEAPSTSAG